MKLTGTITHASVVSHGTTLYGEVTLRVPVAQKKREKPAGGLQKNESIRPLRGKGATLEVPNG